MSRWRYPFKTKAEAAKYVKQAKRETGENCQVFPVEYRVRIYKIFSSRQEFQNYLKAKHNKFLKPI